MARAFDLVHKIGKDDSEDENRIPFSGDDSPEEPEPKRPKRPRVELAFFYVLLFIIFFVMGSTLLSPKLLTNLFHGSKLIPNSLSASNTPQAGFSIQKQGQSVADSSKQLGLGSPTPTPSVIATPSAQASTAPATDTTTPASAAKIQILNGTTKTGAAATLRTKLSDNGIAVANIGNYTSRSVAKTTIYYKPNAKTTAETIQKLIGGILSSTSSGIGSYDFLIVIGKTS